MLTTVETMAAMARMNHGERDEVKFRDVRKLYGLKVLEEDGKPVALQQLEYGVPANLLPGSALLPLPHAIEIRLGDGEVWSAILPTSVRVWPGINGTPMCEILEVVAHKIEKGPVRFTLDGVPWEPSAS